MFSNWRFGGAAPAASDDPVVEAPVVETAPALSAEDESVRMSVHDKAPVVEAPVVEAPVVEAPVVEAPVVEVPVVEAPVVEEEEEEDEEEEDEEDEEEEEKTSPSAKRPCGVDLEVMFEDDGRMWLHGEHPSHRHNEEVAAEALLSSAAAEALPSSAAAEALPSGVDEEGDVHMVEDLPSTDLEEGPSSVDEEGDVRMDFVADEVLPGLVAEAVGVESRQKRLSLLSLSGLYVIKHGCLG